MKKLKHLGNLVLIAILASSLTGCATGIRIMEIAGGIGVKKTAINTETRNTSKLAKKDVKLVFTPIGDGLGFRLQYQPHSYVESRSVIKYDSYGFGPFSGIVALAEFAIGLYIGLKYDERTNIFADDGGSEWNFLGMSVIDAAVALEVSKRFNPTQRTRWEQIDTRPGALEGISNSPVSISLPEFGYRETFRTNSAGEFTIPTSELIGKIPGQKLDPVLHTNSIRINASAKVDGRKSEQSFTMSGYTIPFRSLYQEADERRQLPAGLITEVAFSDKRDFIPNNTLDAGERQGNLEITVKNEGEGPGIDVELHLSSDNLDIQLGKKIQALGEIKPKGERTVVVPIATSLKATGGFANILVEAKEKRGYDAQKQVYRIPVARLQPPRLRVTEVEVNDKTLGNAVGNGNGIIENQETIELKVFINNSGSGNALGTVLELVSLNRGLEVQQGSETLGTIHPNETVEGVLRFRVPRTYEAEALNYELRVNEIRDADSTIKDGILPMDTQSPILAYRISPPQRITNGSSASFTLTPRNTGKLNARNVSLRLSARGATITPSNVNLGMLEAGKSRQPQPFTVSLPRTFKADQLFLIISLSQTEFDDLIQTESYTVKHIEPRLDIADRFVSDTNGDGKIQQGERVEFEVTVTNNGELDALNASVRVSVNDSRIVINEPERMLGRLAPNYTSSDERFAFTIPRAVPAGELSLDVQVTHDDFPTVKRTLRYTVHAEEVATTTVTSTQPTQQPQTLTVVANKPPVIVLTDYTSETVYSPNFTLRASVNDDRGLDVVQVTLNGELNYDSQTDPGAPRQLQESNRLGLIFDVPLKLREGENSVVITARDDNNQHVKKSISINFVRKQVVAGLDNPSDVDVDIPQGRGKNPDAVALVIGIGNYRDAVDATYADRDAVAFREYLIKTFGYSEDRISILTNDRATHRDIDRGLRFIEDRIESGRPSDVVIFYAGHGTFKIEADKSPSHYLVPYDADPNDPEDGYPLDAFYNRLSRLQARSVTAFVDACFSGTDREARKIVEGARNLVLPNMEFPSSSVPVLASSAGNQISSSYELKRHGLFTYYLLKGMRGEADGADDSRRNGKITLNELAAYTQKHVSKAAREEWGRTQEPTLTGSREERVLVEVR